MTTKTRNPLLYPFFRLAERIHAVTTRQIWKIKLRIYAPNTPLAEHNLPLIRLGTQYGGWTFIDRPELHGATIISCGLGEDGSFDVEFAARYNAKVVIVDPTPASIAHFNAITERLGQKPTTPYNKSGRLPATSYDLSTVSQHNFGYCPKAVWTENTTLRFYSPPSESDVSYSISNFLNDYQENNHYIEVPAASVDTLLQEQGLDTPPPLVKFDIEGAEIQVVPDMLKKGIYPDQVLIEFDELSVPCKRSQEGVQQCHDALTAAGYKLIHREKWNFLYTRLVVAR